ncbi:MAG: hypothetical protein HY929_05950 [Euryarchaeota archaeon]|nr:hypothetical protein [Euryarchaeota archaeon]
MSPKDGKCHQKCHQNLWLFSALTDVNNSIFLLPGLAICSSLFAESERGSCGKCDKIGGIYIKRVLDEIRF